MFGRTQFAPTQSTVSGIKRKRGEMGVDTTLRINEVELLPCPFCAGAPTVSKYTYCPDIVECRVCGVCTEPHVWNRRAAMVSQVAIARALAEAHVEIARLSAECEELKEQLKEALVGVTYGRMCEKELRALRSRMKATAGAGDRRTATLGSRISPRVLP
jgi:hypothetical protein